MGRSSQQECLWQTQPLSPAIQVMSLWETPHSPVKVMEHGTTPLLCVRVLLVFKQQNFLFFNVCLFSVVFEETTYTVTEGVDEYVEIKIQSKNIKNIVVVNISLTSDSAKSM